MDDLQYVVDEIRGMLALLGIVVVIGCAIGALILAPRLKRQWPGLKKYRHLLTTMVVRDIKVKYRRSVLGLLWSILNPLLMMIVITVVFSTIFRFEIEYFPIYYIIGSTVFSLITDSTTSAMNSILSSAALLKKVYIPKYLFPLQKVLFALVNFAFSLIAVAVVIAILQMPLQPTIPLILIDVLYVAIFCFGLGLILSAAVVYFRDVAHLYGVLTMAWVYITALFYPFEILPDIAQAVFQFNPALHFVNFARDVMMYGVVPGLEDNLICLGFSLLTLIIGLIFFKRSQDNFILHM